MPVRAIVACHSQLLFWECWSQSEEDCLLGPLLGCSAVCLETRLGGRGGHERCLKVSGLVCSSTRHRSTGISPTHTTPTWEPSHHGDSLRYWLPRRRPRSRPGSKVCFRLLHVRACALHGGHYRSSTILWSAPSIEPESIFPTNMACRSEKCECPGPQFSAATDTPCCFEGTAIGQPMHGSVLWVVKGSPCHPWRLFQDHAIFEEYRS